jgi:polysaccharide export outer membrane protein
MLKTARTFAESGAPGFGVPRELNKQVLAEYRLEPGDVLALEQAEFDAGVRLPADQTVRADGSIDLGKYGRLDVVGRTLDEVQQLVQHRVEEFPETAEIQSEALAETSPPTARPTIVVRLIEPESKVYYVVGEVNSPGTQQLIGRETVLDAIFAAGDLSSKADRHRIILSRPTAQGECRIVMPVCYRHIVQLGDTSTNYQIQPGDRIYVPSLTFWDEVARCIFPDLGETCPECACCQFYGPDAACSVSCVDGQ